MKAADTLALAERIFRFDPVCADRPALLANLVDLRSLEAMLEAARMATITRLATTSSMPEPDIAKASAVPVGAAGRAIGRAKAAATVPELGAALAGGALSAGHAEAAAKALAGVPEKLKPEVAKRAGELVGRSHGSTAVEFGKALAQIVDDVRAETGEERAARQRAANRLSWWNDTEGMLNLRGRFDPTYGLEIIAKIQAMTQKLFNDTIPDGCPTDDPLTKQQWLQAEAFMACLRDGVTLAAPEATMVVDMSTGTVDLGFDLDVPANVINDLIRRANITNVVVNGNRIVDAPGEMNLGRSRRLASPEQTRALRAIYVRCGIPDCPVRFHHLKAHHIVEWHNGGLTDLQNLLPVCPRHHAQIHAEGWKLSLDEDRNLTIELPDGRIMTTGPPRRSKP